MWKGISRLLLLTLTVSRIRGHLAWSGDQLHPVQGLYVKPSLDGSTGDLYVAATEDHGVDTHWLTDHPINFLPSAAATEIKPTKIPVSFTSSVSKTSKPNEETVTTQKRAVITSPKIKYSYPSSEGSPFPPYPYIAVPVTSTSEESIPPCATDGIPGYPGYPPFSPYHYFYPQMMAAVTHTLAGNTDASKENGSSVGSSAYWPGYSYPYQYVMVDPASWLHSQASSSTTPATDANE